MSSIVQLKRSALSGKVPGTGSLNLGELALNTYDGKIFFRRSGSTDTIQEVVTTNVLNTGSVTITGTLTAESIRTNLTGSFGSLNVNDTLVVNHGITTISGSLGITSDLTVLGVINARQFNISVISSSVLFESGSSKFGNTSDDIHSFTGSVQVTGSVTATSFNGTINATNGVVSGSTQITYASISSIPAGIVSGSTQIANLGYATTGSNVFSGSQTITGSVTATSFVGDGSGLTDLVVDLSTAQLNDVDGNNIPARSFAELYLACAVAEIVDLDFGI